MTRERLPPDNPFEWLNRAKSNLNLAKHIIPDTDLEDMCFFAQQAAEKAIKAVFLSKKLNFPYIHDISQLLELLGRSGEIIPPEIQNASSLSLYAVETRYPGFYVSVSTDQYKEAILLAEGVIRWAEMICKESEMR